MTGMTDAKVWAVNVRSTPRAIDMIGTMLGGYDGMWVDPNDPLTASALEAGDLTIESSLAPKETPPAVTPAVTEPVEDSVSEVSTTIAEEG